MYHPQMKIAVFTNNLTMQHESISSDNYMEVKAKFLKL
jgi:hypothetical protein